MRKVLSLCGMIVAVLVMTFGCQKQEKVNSGDSKKTSELLSNLEAFNQQNLQKLSPATRGFWTTFFRVCAIVGSDVCAAVEGGKVGGTVGAIGGPAGAIIGAGVGGLICGAGGSYLAYCGTENFTKPYGDNNPWVSKDPLPYVHNMDVIYNDPYILYEAILHIDSTQLKRIKEDANVAVSFPSEYKHVEEVGIKHNAILESISKVDLSHTTEITNSSSDKPVFPSDDVETYIKDYVKSQEFKSAFQTILNNVNLSLNEIGGLNMESYLAGVSEENLSPLTKNILRLFMDIYTQYPNSFEDIDFIVNYYVNTIEASGELTSSEKESLYCGMAVASYSPRYWASNLEN